MSGPVSTGERVRARSIEEFIGQYRLKEQLTTHAQAAIVEDRLLDHVLLVGPPGSGKTTLARLIAALVKDPFHSIKMPMGSTEFVIFCQEWTRGGVLLLDEIHAAPKAFQELLLTALEDGYLQPPSGVPVDVRHITFIGATTEPQKVIKPLWDRFLIKPEWEPYSDEDMAAIISGMASRAGVDIPDVIAAELCRATAGTPRVAGSLVVAFRDLSLTGQNPSVPAVLRLAGVDEDGLTNRHLTYLRTLKNLGGTTGLKNISSMMQLSPAVAEELERLLLDRGLIRLGSKGRSLTLAGHGKLPSTKVPDSLAERRGLAS